MCVCVTSLAKLVRERILRMKTSGTFGHEFKCGMGMTSIMITWSLTEVARPLAWQNIMQYGYTWA